MTVVLLVVVALAMILGYIFKRWALFILAGLASAGLGIIQVSTFAQATAGWLFGWVLMALGLFCIVESFIIQSKLAQESQDKMEPRKTEEEEYSDILDKEVNKAVETKAKRRARDLFDRFR